VRQRGTKVLAGSKAFGMGKDQDTIFAVVDGKVQFHKGPEEPMFISVLPVAESRRVKPRPREV